MTEQQQHVIYVFFVNNKRQIHLEMSVTLTVVDPTVALIVSHPPERHNIADANNCQLRDVGIILLLN